MPKVGIITLYYNNNNYGGIAQAFALTEYLNNIGYEAELVSYKRLKKANVLPESQEKKEGSIEKLLRHCEGMGKKIRRKLIEQPIERHLAAEFQDKIELRLQSFEKSRDAMPHSKIYTVDNIGECADIYDIFITGSDQVWKPGVIQGAYVWDFLSKDKKCISYAASITTEDYPEWYTEYMKKNLDKYSWISVRETGAQKYLEKILNKEVDQVVDPTFLLDEEKWNSIASQRLVEEDYVFVYLLGDSYTQRRTVKKMAKALGLPIVVLPHLENKVRLCDWKYGDISLYDVGLPEFLSLIKHAKMVFTDSFHAAVFSNIFETEFWVFERSVVTKREKMGSRLETLLGMFGEEDRKIKDSVHIPVSELQKKIDFKQAKMKMSPNIKKSKEKLQKAMESGRKN